MTAATGALVLAACVAVQQVEADDVTAAPGIQLVSGHGHHHKAHHGKHHRHHHAHHRAGGHHPGRRMVHYTVRPGDTATELAVRFHAWTDELLAVNHLGPHEVIYVGETLTIPVVRSAARRAARHRHHYAATHHHAKHSHHGAHHKGHHGHKHGHHGHKHGHNHGHHGHKHGDGHGHRRHHHENHHSAHHRHHAKHHGNHHRHHRVHLPNPDQATVRRVIIKTSHRYGVGSNLALAISWQESGWQMDQISSAHALGAMQVLPSTGRWLSTVVGRRLELRDLHDNVTAGVVLIRVLREQASVRHSVAGYYQGLASVRADGMYRDTKHYVSNVLYLRKLLRHGWNPA